MFEYDHASTYQPQRNFMFSSSCRFLNFQMNQPISLNNSNLAPVDFSKTQNFIHSNLNPNKNYSINTAFNNGCFLSFSKLSSVISYLQNIQTISSTQSQQRTYSTLPPNPQEPPKSYWKTICLSLVGLGMLGTWIYEKGDNSVTIESSKNVDDSGMRQLIKDLVMKSNLIILFKL